MKVAFTSISCEETIADDGFVRTQSALDVFADWLDEATADAVRIERELEREASDGNAKSAALLDAIRASRASATRTAKREPAA